MPTQPTDAEQKAEAFIAAALALAAADHYLSGALALAIGAVRAKYPAPPAVGPRQPDPG